MRFRVVFAHGKIQFGSSCAEKLETRNSENAGSVRLSVNRRLAGKNRQQQQNNRGTRNDEHDDDNELKMSIQSNIAVSTSPG